MARRKLIKPHRKEFKVRVNNVGPLLNSNLPLTAQFIINGLLGMGKQRSSLSFAVNRLPPTVNHMYEKTRFSVRLSEETKIFRDLVAIAIGHQRFTFKTGGTVAMVIFLESPNWITKKLTIREWDVDNRMKSLGDAIKNFIELPDETTWEIHIWKVASKNIRTTCHLFDLGDVVNFYS